MQDDFQLILELVVRPRATSGKFIRRFGPYIAALASRYGEYCGSDASVHFIKHLKENEWQVLRSWLSQSQKTSLHKFLSRRAELFFRDLRRRLVTEAIRNTPWIEILDRAKTLSTRDRILCLYRYHDGLTGPSLRRVILDDVRLALDTNDSIAVSVSNALPNLLLHCHPDDRSLIEAVLQLRQRRGPRRPNIGGERVNR